MTKTPLITSTDKDIRRLTLLWRTNDERVCLVPTMGALHEGHLSLIDFARQRAERVVVSIFVNPAQFAEGEDFGTYPRTWDADITALSRKNVDAIYAPSAQTMYPDNFSTKITLEGPARELETKSRPHFFSGVATVVAKLILGVLPDYAVFGEKDYQQLLVITQMVQDLQIPCEILGAPTLRAEDGLALSSRNAYLSEEERAIAPRLYEVMKACAIDIRKNSDTEATLKNAEALLLNEGFKVDYLELRDAGTLKPVHTLTERPLRLLVAAWLGKTRLIDNIAT